MLNTYTTQTFIGCDTTYEDSNLVIVGAPFDGTTSYRPGTRFAPSQVRVDSYGLETYSPYLDLDLTDFKISDIGDIDMPFGNPKAALAAIKETLSTLLTDRKKT
ncbi:MAG: arginase family protein, partial [Cellulosilyticaceae bacterium]